MVASYLENGRYRNLRKELEGHVAVANACNLFTTCGDSCISGLHVLTSMKLLTVVMCKGILACVHIILDKAWYAGAGTL